MRLRVTGATGYLGRELARPDVVIHTAYREDQPDAQAINRDGSGNVARAARAVGARLIQLSTDVVFCGSCTGQGVFALIRTRLRGVREVLG